MHDADLAQNPGPMESIPRRLLQYLRRKLWAMIVAYMLGMHNFYTGDNKTSEDIAITIEYNVGQENDLMND